MQEKSFDQLELFTQGGSGNQAVSGSSRVFINYVSKYEKVILVIIGFAVMGIVCFSLGVEKGKSLVTLKSDTQLDIAARQVPAAPVAAPVISVSIPRPASQEAVKLPQNKNDFNEYIQNYTIQVASFSSRINAQKEADLLKKKGMSPLVVAKGKFSVVCVGNFSKREEAETLLPKLKKQYTDCHVRRL
jgi:hypothetical protein